MKYCRLLFCLLLAAFFSSLRADPANILVGDLSFVRPEAWQWAPPPPESPATSRLVIHEKPMVDVRFYAPGKTPAQAKAQWKTYVDPADAHSFLVQEKKIGERTITYISFHGKLTLLGEHPKENTTFVGAVIPYQNKLCTSAWQVQQPLFQKPSRSLRR